MSRTPCLLLALAGAATALGGCSGEPATITDQDAVLRVKLSEYRIEPQNLKVQATDVPTRIKIVATNEGRLVHSVKLEPVVDEAQNAPDDEAAPVDEATVKAVGVSNVPPGQVGRSEDLYCYPGEYRVADTIGNHENLGQYGKLTIVPPEGYVPPDDAKPGSCIETEPITP